MSRREVHLSQMKHIGGEVGIAEFRRFVSQRPKWHDLCPRGWELLPCAVGSGLFAAALVLAALPLAASAQVADPERGRALYQTHCGGCHYERIHDGRVRQAVRDLADLRDMVAKWAPQTKRSYTLEELEDIVQYLNESHYRFALPPRRKP